MFFSLVKKGITEEEKQRIFAKSNKLEAKRNKQQKRKKWKEDEERRKREVEYKAQRQLKHFRKELEDQQFGHPPDRNMEKRGLGQKRGNLELDYVDLDDPSQLEEGEIIEGWRYGCDDDQDDFLSHVSIYEQLQKSQSQTLEEMDLGEDKRNGGEIEGVAASRRKDTNDGVSLEEKLAADQFEKTDECELNFGIV